VIGKLAEASGTIFVDRQSLKSTRAMVECSATALRRGYCVAGFPEGTSSDGTDVAAFHANLFDAAVRAGVDVQPLVLRYVDDATGLRHEAAAFTGHPCSHRCKDRGQHRAVEPGACWRVIVGWANAQVTGGSRIRSSNQLEHDPARRDDSKPNTAG
jgi:hypothetical protein